MQQLLDLGLVNAGSAGDDDQITTGSQPLIGASVLPAPEMCDDQNSGLKEPSEFFRRSGQCRVSDDAHSPTFRPHGQHCPQQLLDSLGRHPPRDVHRKLDHLAKEFQSAVRRRVDDFSTDAMLQQFFVGSAISQPDGRCRAREIEARHHNRFAHQRVRWRECRSLNVEHE